MVDVLIFVDFEAGHVFPTLQMAQNLKNAGYRVAYLGIADTMEVVTTAGFDTYVIFEDIYPKGSVGNAQNEPVVTPQRIQQHLTEMLDGGLEPILDEIQPKVIITSFFLRVEALILAYRYSVTQMIFWPFLHRLDIPDENIIGNIPALTSIGCMRRIFEVVDIELRFKLLDFLKKKGIVLEKFTDLANPLSDLGHIVLCPSELEIDDKYIDKNVSYLGPGIRKVFTVTEEELSIFLPPDRSKKLIFLSMGSQINSYPEKADAFFRMVMEIMKEDTFTPYHLLIAAGVHASTYQEEGLNENVSVFEWVPQTDVLQHTSLAIIHGGLGSVKECIYYGVPMLAVPMGRDQYFNAQRVLHHKLGLTLYTDQLSAERVKNALLEILRNKSATAGLTNMQILFRDREDEKPEISMISEVLNPILI